MKSRLSRSITLTSVLLLSTLLTITLAVVQAFQILSGDLPDDSFRLKDVPFSHFIHVLGGATFGITGPLQFGRVAMLRFGRLHRGIGKAFVAAGSMISISSIHLLWKFPEAYSPTVTIARLVFGIALGGALLIGVQAIRKRNFTRHRNWMIRAYAIGMGATAVSMIFFPFYLITGQPPTGLISDIAFLGSWTACVIVAECLVRRY